MTYDPKFTQKQMYDQYGSSRNTTTKTVGPKGYSKKNVTKPTTSSGYSGNNPNEDEAVTRGIGAKPPSFGGGQDNNPNKDEYENKSTIDKVKEKAVDLFKSFGAKEPEALIVDGKRVYQGPLFRGFDPTVRVGEFGLDNNPNRDASPAMPYGTVNMFGVNTDNPRLNMFGVERGAFRDPTQLIPPVLPETPANMDPLTRGLSQAMIPDPVVPTAGYKTQVGDTLFSIQKTLKENGINTTVEEIAEINDIGLDGIFGIKPGTELKLPMPNTDAAPKEVKAALEKLTPITMTEEKSLKEQLREYTDYYKKLASDALGIDVETDQSKIEAAVDKAGGLGAKQKVTTKDTKENITAYQTQLTNLGFNVGVVDGGYGKNTAKGIKRYQLHNGLETTGKMNEETAKSLNSGNSIVPTSKKVGNLTVSTAYRDDIDSNQLVIATDFNATAGAKGVEVVLPPNVFDAGAGNPYYDAAVKYTELVKDFFDKKGYGEYKVRPSNVVGGTDGLKKQGQKGQRGRPNTIHTEPFFNTDTKATNIINANKKEFFDLYVQAFGSLDTTLIAPHGGTKTNIVDQGTSSSVLGSEKDLGDEGIKYIMDNY